MKGLALKAELENDVFNSDYYKVVREEGLSSVLSYKYGYVTQGLVTRIEELEKKLERLSN